MPYKMRPNCTKEAKLLFFVGVPPPPGFLQGVVCKNRTPCMVVTCEILYCVPVLEVKINLHNSV